MECCAQVTSRLLVTGILGIASPGRLSFTVIGNALCAALFRLLVAYKLCQLLRTAHTDTKARHSIILDSLICGYNFFRDGPESRKETLDLGAASPNLSE